MSASRAKEIRGEKTVRSVRKVPCESPAHGRIQAHTNGSHYRVRRRVVSPGNLRAPQHPSPEETLFADDRLRPANVCPFCLAAPKEYRIHLKRNHPAQLPFDPRLLRSCYRTIDGIDGRYQQSHELL